MSGKGCPVSLFPEKYGTLYPEGQTIAINCTLSPEDIIVPIFVSFIKTTSTVILVPKLKLMKKEVEDLNEWYNITLYRVVEVAKKVRSKYTRSKVRKAITNGFEYVIDELLNSQTGNEKDKERYYKAIIKTANSFPCLL